MTARYDRLETHADAMAEHDKMTGNGTNWRRKSYVKKHVSRRAAWLARGGNRSRPRTRSRTAAAQKRKRSRDSGDEDPGTASRNSVSSQEEVSDELPLEKEADEAEMYRSTRRYRKRPRQGMPAEVIKKTIDKRKYRVPHWSRHFKEINTSANGNCFFNAVHSAIKSARREDEMVIRRSFLRNTNVEADAQKCEVKWTPQLLRAVVASSAIDMEDDKTVFNILRTWHDLSRVTDERDRPISELKHLHHVNGRFGSAKWRASMAKVLLDRHLYWAEELSLYVVEMLLNVRFLVVVDDEGCVAGLTGQKGLMEYIAEQFPQEVLVQLVGTEPYPHSREGA